MRKPIIGITTGNQIITEGVLCGTARAGVSSDYIQAVCAIGGIPILLPVVTDMQSITIMLNYIDGLILSGGGDVDPGLYLEEPHPGLGKVSPERDNFEIAATKYCIENNKPVLGICRGIQIINVAFGGSLYQDIFQQKTEYCLQHNQTSPKYVATHTVNIEKGSKLHQLLQKCSIRTNSFHHQAIKHIAPGFIVNSFTQDGIIEGLEKQGPEYVIGVQWHPEMMVLNHPDMLTIFDGLIQACQQHSP